MLATNPWLEINNNQGEVGYSNIFLPCFAFWFEDEDLEGSKHETSLVFMFISKITPLSLLEKMH